MSGDCVCCGGDGSRGEKKISAGHSSHAGETGAMSPGSQTKNEQKQRRSLTWGEHWLSGIRSGRARWRQQRLPAFKRRRSFGRGVLK